MQNKIQIVFDTSYLESKKYNYKSSVFERIIKGVRSHKCINVYLPENMDHEIRTHLLKSSDDISSNIKKIPEILRIELLKDKFHNLAEMPASIFELAIEQYELFLEILDVEIIINDKECTDELWARYFTQKPPFSEKKKSEFPDAMALLSVFNYFKIKNINTNSIIIVSCDKDWENYCNDINVCIVDDDRKLIEELNKRDPLLEKPVIIRLINEESERYIAEKIKNYLGSVYKEPRDDSEAINFEALDFSIKNISEGEIVSVADGEINLLYNVQYSTSVSYLESDSWHRDSESKSIFYTEYISGVVESNTIVEIQIAIGIPSDDLDIDDYDIEDDIVVISPASLIIDLSEMKNINREFGIFYY